MDESKQRQQHKKQYNIAPKCDASDNNQPDNNLYHQIDSIPTTESIGKRHHNNKSNENNTT